MSNGALLRRAGLIVVATGIAVAAAVLLNLSFVAGVVTVVGVALLWSVWWDYRNPDRGGTRVAGQNFFSADSSVAIMNQGSSVDATGRVYPAPDPRDEVPNPSPARQADDQPPKEL